MRRALLNFASVGLVLACVGIGVLWLRSYRTQDEIRHSSITDTGAEPTPLHCRRLVVWSAWGGIVVIAERQERGRGDAMKPDPGWQYRRQNPRPYPDIRRNPFTVFDRWGIQLFNRAQRIAFADPQLMVRIPYWLMMLLLLPLPLLVLVRAWRARSRASRSFCSACGYDLRATPERCPECGAVSKPAPRTAA
jgi:hypothetical protein